MEIGGKLQHAMVRYLNNELPIPGDNILIRDYLQQWIGSPVWEANPDLDDDGRAALARLRSLAAGLKRRAHFDRFIEELIELGMDPL